MAWVGWALSGVLSVALAATFSRTGFVLLALEAVALDANGKGDCSGGSCNSDGWVASLPLRLPSGDPTAFRGFDWFANGWRFLRAQLRSGNESPNQSEFLV